MRAVNEASGIHADQTARELVYHDGDGMPALPRFDPSIILHELNGCMQNGLYYHHSAAGIIWRCAEASHSDDLNSPIWTHQGG